MKNILFLLFLFFSFISFSQSDTLKRHEIGISFQQRISYIDSKDISSQAIGFEYRIYSKDVYFFKTRISYIYNYNYVSTSLNNLYYKANTINSNIGMMIKVMQNNQVKPYIGLLYINDFIYNEEIEITHYSNAWEKTDYNIHEDFRLLGSFAINIGVNFLYKNKFTFNAEAIYYLVNTFISDMTTNAYVQPIVEFNFGIGYRL